MSIKIRRWSRWPKCQRQKTDRHHALMLAKLHRAGELTAIHLPDAVDESGRDLTHARTDAVHDLTRAKLRLKSFLLRQGYRYTDKANWSEPHQRYWEPLPVGTERVFERARWVKTSQV